MLLHSRSDQILVRYSISFFSVSVDFLAAVLINSFFCSFVSFGWISGSWVVANFFHLLVLFLFICFPLICWLLYHMKYLHLYNLTRFILVFFYYHKNLQFHQGCVNFLYPLYMCTYSLNCTQVMRCKLR